MWHLFDLGCFQVPRDFFQHGIALLQEVIGIAGGHRFNPPDAGTDAPFGNNLEKPQLIGVFDVVTATEFGIVVTNLNDADLIAVLVGEEGNRAHFFGRINVGFHRGYRNFLKDLLIDHCFNRS